MKAAKRQTRSREVEAEQNEVNERKKARLSSISRDPDTSPKKKPDTVTDDIDNPDSNGDSNCIPELVHLPSKILEPKTSTPIIQNGLISNLSSKFLNSSSLPDAILSPSPDMPEEVDMNDAGVPEHNENEVNGVEVDTVSVGFPPSSNDSSQEKNKNVEVLPTENITEEIDVVTCDVNDHGTSKCDVEFFVSSRLDVHELEGHSDSILAVAADDDIIITASQDTTIKMWDSHKKKEMCNFQGHTGSVTAINLLTAEQTAALSAKMGFTDVTRIVLSGSSDCSIRLWSIPGGIELLSIYTYNGITSLGYMEDQNYIVVGTDGGKLEVWDLHFSKMLHSVLAHENLVTDVKVDDSYIYTTSLDGKVKVWVLDEGELQAIYCRSRKSPMANGQMKPTEWKCVTFEDGMMYLGDDTSDIKVLDWKAGRLRMMRNQIQPNGVIDAVFAKKDILLSSSFEPYNVCGAINVWQLPTMTYICTMSGDVGKVNALALTETKDGVVRVVSGGSKLLVWDYICSQPPSPGKDNKYFCREIECLGEDTSLQSIERSSTVNQSAMDRASQSWKCTFL